MKDIKSVIRLNCDEELDIKYFDKNGGITDTTCDYSELLDYINNLEDRIDKAIDNCKKSIESINQKLENNKEPFEVGKIIYLNDYQVCRLKAIKMKCKELLEILGDKE